MSVSRETVPGPPDEVSKIFGSKHGLISRFTHILGTDGVTRGVIGPREVPRIWERHIINCSVVQSAVPSRARVADVGSGGGLPGIVWAIMRPDIHISLIEPLLRRTTFLEQIIGELELVNVSVLRARAEEVQETFDVVTARAVARMKKLVPWTMPLVREGGVLLALKGQNASVELEEARQVLNQFGARSMQVTCYETTDIPTRVVEVRK